MLRRAGLQHEYQEQLTWQCVVLTGGHVHKVSYLCQHFRQGDSLITVSAHQPAYLPWLGYIDKLKRSDVFVFMDSVQFDKGNFMNRNKIKTQSGPAWLTVPVKSKGHLDSTMVDLEINNDMPWSRKHLRTIEASYRKAKNFENLYPPLEKEYSVNHTHLADLCWSQLQFWITHFEISVKLVKLSSLGLTSKKSDLVLDICKAVGADRYFSGAMGKTYLDEHAFQKAGIELEYQEFQHPVYPQLFGEFVLNLGVVDYAMNR